MPLGDPAVFQITYVATVFGPCTAHVDMLPPCSARANCEDLLPRLAPSEPRADNVLASHNVMQNKEAPGTQLTDDDKALFEDWTAQNVESFWSEDSPFMSDIVVIDDPQRTLRSPLPSISRCTDVAVCYSHGCHTLHPQDEPEGEDHLQVAHPE